MALLDRKRRRLGAPGSQFVKNRRDDRDIVIPPFFGIAGPDP